MRFSLLAVGLLAFTAGTANASTSYAFSTAISYAGGTGVADVSGNCTNNVLGSLNATYCIDFASSVAGLNYVVAYAPNNGSGTAGAPPIGTADNFGLLQVYCEIAGTSTVSAGCGSVTLDGTITVTVNQTLPAVVTPVGTFVAALSLGFINPSTGAGVATFSTTSFNYSGGSDNIQYYLQQPTFPVTGYILNNPGTNNPTSLQGGIIDESAPEPATLALIAGGLGLLGLMRRRKA